MVNEKYEQKQKEWERLQAMIAESKRQQKIASALREFESFQRTLRLGRKRNSSKPKPEPKQSVEDIMIRRGILSVKKMELTNRDG